MRYWNPETLKYITSPDKDVKDLKVEDTGPVWEAMAQGLISGEDKAKTRMADDAKVAAYKTFITYHSSQGGCPKLTIATLLNDSMVQRVRRSVRFSSVPQSRLAQLGLCPDWTLEYPRWS